MIELPLSKSQVMELNIGDELLLKGKLFTARDEAHKLLLSEDFKPIKGGVVYHCGPIVKGNKVIAAGPTTSARMNVYSPQLIDQYEIKAIIGKGGMSQEVLEAMKGKAVYLAAIGGAGTLYATLIKLVKVHKPKLGMAESIWELEVSDFPVVVAMDAHGNSLYSKVLSDSKNKLNKLLKL